MKRVALICVLTLIVSHNSPAQTKPEAAGSCSPALLKIDGNQIWVSRQGQGNLTVVFEAGFGNDSNVWSQITPKTQAAGVQTFVYDRAGMGKSTINMSTPYSIATVRSTLEKIAMHSPRAASRCDWYHSDPAEPDSLDEIAKPRFAAQGIHTRLNGKKHQVG